MNRYKPKVIISQVFDPFMATALAVSTAMEEQSGDDPQFGVFFGEFEDLNPSLDDIIGLQNQQLAAFESSQSSIELRDTAFSTMKDALIQVRDMGLAAHDGNPSAIGAYGFEVRQSKTSGTRSRAKVIIPTNPDQFIATFERVRAAVAAANNAGVPVALSMNTVMTSVDVAAARGSAIQNQSLQLSKSEEGQSLLADRNRAVDGVRGLLIRIRNYGFGKFGPGNYEQISTLGFEVQSSATQNAGGGSAGSGPDAGPDPEPQPDPGPVLDPSPVAGPSPIV